MQRQRWFNVPPCLSLASSPPLQAQTGNGVSLQIRAHQITVRATPNLDELMMEPAIYSYKGGLNAFNSPPGAGSGGR